MKIVSTRKVFLATYNGWTAEDFHRECDNVGPTLVLVRNYKPTNVFGGFTMAEWDSPIFPSFKEDKSAFLFSVEDELIFKVKNPKKAICVHSNVGPNFGDVDLYFLSPMNQNNNGMLKSG